MKKVLALVLAMVMVFSLAACTGGGSTTDAPASEAPTGEPATQPPETEPPAEETDAPAEEGYEIALVTDVGNIDDKSFNEGSWNGVVEYAEANNKTYAYYRPSEDSTEARVEAIGTAVSKGAKVIVCPGYMFAETLSTVQGQYPDVMFLGLDVAEGDMVDGLTENTALITYQEEQAGYLAGYAAVKDGYTKLGFLGGMAVPAVIRYGYGFVQGADDAAAELGITVDINYWYGNSFVATDDIKIKMDGWFTGGTEVVFACGGGIYLSALQAAEQSGTGKVIGVDVDQAAESELIITSAMKDLTESTKVALGALFDNGGTWPAEYAGKGAVLGAADGAVALPTADESWRLETFTVEEYNDVLQKIISGDIEISSATDTQPEVSASANVDYQG